MMAFRILLLLVLSHLAYAQQYRAFWSDAFHEGFKTPDQISQLVENVSAAKSNAIFVQARRRADSYYRQSLEPFAEDRDVPAGFDPLEDLILKAHARGIEVHAWFVVYPAWPGTLPPPKDPQHLYYSHLAGASGEDRWLGVDSTGKEGTSIDPGHPAVLPYLIDVFLEPLRRYNIDGIHLDYIRYPEDADYGYNPTALERFRRQATRAGTPARTDAAFSQWRRDQVTALVRQLYLRTQQLRPEVKISAATITWGNGPLNDAEFRAKDAYSRVYQDWRGWLEEGILDFSVPMNYFRESQYAAYLNRWAEYQKDRQYSRGYINGLGNYLNTLPQTLDQLPRVLAPSACGNVPFGVNFYSYAATRSDAPERPNPEFYQAIGQFFADPASPPELPWKVRPQKGHLLGRVEIGGGPLWWRDGLTVTLTPRDGDPVSRKTDSSGFFGWVDLPPGSYQIGLEANGRRIFLSDWLAVEAGRVSELPVYMQPEDVQAVMPALWAAEDTTAAPGEVIRLSGRNLAEGSGDTSTLLVVNGQSAAIDEIGPDFVTFRLPASRPQQWNIRIRRAGVESEPLILAVAEPTLNP